ncbi:hypothetical protein OZX68_03655 [Streptococcaceae bacterium ESL0729]|nr:hypothetical protein OZX68_03655 [Streptococcaceae bacterium ESL0729]
MVLLREKYNKNPDVREKNKTQYYSDLERDRTKYREVKNILGKSAPKTLEEYRNIRYNGDSKYKELMQNYRDFIKWSNSNFPSEKSLNGHYKTHGKEFGNISKEEYINKAVNLLAEPISDKILGYEYNGRRVRYDKEKIYLVWVI